MSIGSKLAGKLESFRYHSLHMQDSSLELLDMTLLEEEMLLPVSKHNGWLVDSCCHARTLVVQPGIAEPQ